MYKVYKYVNTKNGKVYIGQTYRSLDARAGKDGSGYKNCTRFYDAIMYYGWESFVPEILGEYETRDEANAAEVEFISKYNSVDSNYGYNIETGGRFSEEGRITLSKVDKANYANGRINPMAGKKHKPESIEKMRNKKVGENNPMYGSKWTETQRARSGTKGKKLNLTEEQRETIRVRSRKIGKKNAKKIRCIEDDIEFNSITEAADYYSVNLSCISAQLHGKQHVCKGKHFEFID